ncbi:unnamed protein product, partial [Ectocarpus sp. 12 AP-2014]
LVLLLKFSWLYIAPHFEDGYLSCVTAVPHGNKIFGHDTCSSLTQAPPRCHRISVVGNLLLETECDACHKTPPSFVFSVTTPYMIFKHSLDKRPNYAHWFSSPHVLSR